MTWTWSIPVRIETGLELTVPALLPERTRVVIPTFSDWDEARETIASMLECRPGPAELVLVNDNVGPSVPTWVHRSGVRVVNYRGNRGPAFARNAGASLATNQRIDWLYFTDTGCTRSRSFLSKLRDASASHPRSTVAIAGPVSGVVSSPRDAPINRFMTEEAILNPPIGATGPQAVITANAAVSMAAFRIVGGFDTSYPFAAAEDLDLGLKLRRVGTIGWAPKAVVEHRFRESIEDFRRRFRRYGAGNAHLEIRWGLPSMRTAPFAAHDPELQWLADEQVRAMQQGYDEHRRALVESAA